MKKKDSRSRNNFFSKYNTKNYTYLECSFIFKSLLRMINIALMGIDQELNAVLYLKAY